MKTACFETCLGRGLSLKAIKFLSVKTSVGQKFIQDHIKNKIYNF